MSLPLAGCGILSRLAADPVYRDIANPEQLYGRADETTLGDAVSDFALFSASNHSLDKLKGGEACKADPSKNECASTFWRMDADLRKIAYQGKVITSDTLALYFDAGVAVSNMQCDLYFARLQQWRNRLMLEKGLLSNLSTLTTTTMAFSGVDPDTTGIVAGAFGFGTSNNDVIMASYLFAPSLETLNAGVGTWRALIYRDRRARLFEDGAATSAKLNYFSVRSQLQSYDTTCSPLAIRAFVNEKLRIEAEKSLTAGATKIEVKAQAAHLAGMFANRITLDDRKLVAAIYAKANPKYSNEYNKKDGKLSAYAKLLKDKGLTDEQGGWAKKEKNSDDDINAAALSLGELLGLDADIADVLKGIPPEKASEGKGGMEPAGSDPLSQHNPTEITQ